MITLTTIGGTLAAFIAAVFAAWMIGRKSARDAVALDQARAELEARNKADEIEQAVAGNDPADNRAKLKSRWGAK